MAKPNPLNALIERALTEPGADVRYDGNGDVRRITPVRPIVRSLLDLNGDMLPDLQTKSGMHLKRPPVGHPAGQTITLAADIIKRSLVAQAGAEVIIYEDPTELNATGTDGEPLLVEKPTYFVTVESAPFTTVANGLEVGVSSLPISRAKIFVDDGLGQGPKTGTLTYMVRYEFTRAYMKSYPDFTDQIMHSFTQGLADTADALLLGAIAAGTPQPAVNDVAQPNLPLQAFSLGDAAAHNVRFDELRALIGTNAAGAAVGQDGVLRASGVRGELTPAIAPTIVGAFSRSAIMIRSTVDVYAERVSVNPLSGTMAVTAVAALQPLTPDLSRFWTAA
ncbi:hypothetical protein [Paraburkholderia sacchari]|uniref:hypothetical protein n=1 Tax=Paraburkholderia sacchari TaxID=159450 RepID=UPI000542EBD1|nr:hypothetical protein [Paraburkholderia sacchari]NLP64294.1 hypothetical protein [Paraburkholderia sacchari]